MCCEAWLPSPENCPEWKFQFNLVCHSWSAVPLMISMKFITLRLFAKLGTLSNVYLCLRSHIIYPLMSFWSYPIKSSWESNDQQNMETQTPAPRRGGNGGHWTIIPYKPRSHSLTRAVCRCAIITMMAGPTIHIIHNFFLTLTLTKQNKMLSIVSVDHGNNMIVCREGR